MMLAVAATCLLVLVLVALVATFYGRSNADKLLGALLASGLGMALLAISALWLGQSALLDVALVMAALAVTVGSTYAKNRRRPEVHGGRKNG